MSIDYGRRLSATVTNTLDSHLLNPFAENTSSAAIESFSEGDHDLVRKPTLRRGSLEKNARSQHISGGRRVRSRTEFNGSSSNSGFHPLRSAGLVPGPNDAGVTRPHLSRVLNVGILVDAPPVANDYESTPVEVRDVFIHVVSPGDSLAGVSLKYGIPMADLRRVNHLWASDSIHLRTQLYVPIDKATRLKPITSDNLISITPDEETIETTSSRDLSMETHPFTARPSGAETIRRVPASQMSFFPPPSATKPPTTTRFSQEHVSSRTTQHTRYTSHPSNSLTSLLASLPIAASTRDTIIARLSFESVSSSYSDRDSDVHELDDVSTGSTNDFRHTDDESQPTSSLVTPKATHWVTPRATHRIPHVSEQSQSTSSPTLAHVAHARHLSTSPRSYIPPHPEIRTVQMEPSPEMQIPLLSRRLSPRTKVSAESNLPDTDFELENIA